MQQQLICFGEVLWDVLPSGKVAGGAPMNVAFHLNNFGLPTKMISRIGQDALGEELLNFLRKKQIPIGLIQQDASSPTSTVQVSLDEGGHASYEIVQPVAWDFINLTPEVREAVQNSAAFIHGSLAARSEKSKQTLFQLLELAPLKVFDVNLRAPHYSQLLLEQLLAQTDYAKMNEEELEEIVGWYTDDKSEEQKLEYAKKKFDLQGIIVTKGKDGVIYLDDSGLYEQKAFPITVVDTVGSGDSFLAAFLTKMLAGAPPQECLRFASATGALVATKKGGTPSLTIENVYNFIKYAVK